MAIRTIRTMTDGPKHGHESCPAWSLVWLRNRKKNVPVSHGLPMLQAGGHCMWQRVVREWQQVVGNNITSAHLRGFCDHHMMAGSRNLSPWGPHTMPSTSGLSCNSRRGETSGTHWFSLCCQHLEVQKLEQKKTSSIVSLRLTRIKTSQRSENVNWISPCVVEGFSTPVS